MGQERKIKCPYCEHKGHSIMEEDQECLVTIVSLAILYLLIGFFTIILMPCVCGIFRSQIHRCPRCLNEHKEESVYSTLDDNVLNMQVGTYFGCLIKRRSLVKALVLGITCALLFWVYEATNSTPTWMIEHTGKIDESITWEVFNDDLKRARSSGEHVSTYNKSVVSWDGTVVKVELLESNLDDV